MPQKWSEREWSELLAKEIEGVLAAIVQKDLCILDPHSFSKPSREYQIAFNWLVAENPDGLFVLNYDPVKGKLKGWTNDIGISWPNGASFFISLMFPSAKHTNQWFAGFELQIWEGVSEEDLRRAAAASV